MEIVLDTTLTDVTVYPDRARVTCRGQCQMATGTHRLLVEALPLSLDPDSVRVAGQGSARVRLLGVDVSRQYYEETPADRVRELERQIEQLEDEARVIEDEKAGWTAHADYVQGLRQATAEYARGLSRGRTGIADQAELVRFLQEQDHEIRSAIRELEEKHRELNRRLQKMRRQLKDYQSARPRQRYQIQIEVEAQTEGDFRPELSYVVGQAGWRPLYDIRLLETEDGRILETNYIAQVTQNSGQDWERVSLTVSTARPALNRRLPELQPWYVDVYTPLPRQPARSLKMAAGAPEPAQAREMEEKAVDAAVPEAEPALAEAEVAVAAVQSSGTTVTFSVAGETDIPSDGSPHKTTISQFQLEPELDYLAVPKHTNAVYRRATVNNTGPSPLLAGPATLFVEDEFIGRTELEYTPAGGEIELLLGVEERLTVERELDRREVDKRLLRDNRQLRYGYKIEIKNLLPTDARVEIHDHIPVARHEQIKVKLEQVDPQPAEKSELNLLQWHFNLNAGDEQTISYRYTIEHPRSLRITGLTD